MFHGQQFDEFASFVNSFVKDQNLKNDGSLWFDMSMEDLNALELNLTAKTPLVVRQRFYKFQILFACYSLSLSPQEASKISVYEFSDLHKPNINESEFLAAYDIIEKWQASFKTQKLAKNANNAAVKQIGRYAYSVEEISSLFSALSAEQQSFVTLFKKIYQEICLQYEYEPAAFEPLFKKIASMDYVRVRDLAPLINFQLRFDDEDIKKIAQKALQLARDHRNDWEKDASWRKELGQLGIKHRIQRFRDFIDRADPHAGRADIWCTPMLWIKTLRENNPIDHLSFKKKMTDQDIQRVELVFACRFLNTDPNKLRQFKRMSFDDFQTHSRKRKAFNASCRAIENWQTQWQEYEAPRALVSFFKPPPMWPPPSESEIAFLYAALLEQEKDILRAFRVIYTSLSAANDREPFKDLLACSEKDSVSDVWNIVLAMPKNYFRFNAVAALYLAEKYYANCDPANNPELFTQMFIHVFETDRNPFKKTNIVPGKTFYREQSLRREFLEHPIDMRVIKERMADQYHDTRGGKLLMHSKMMLDRVNGERAEANASTPVRPARVSLL